LNHEHDLIHGNYKDASDESLKIYNLLKDNNELIFNQEVKNSLNINIINDHNIWFQRAIV